MYKPSATLQNIYYACKPRKYPKVNIFEALLSSPKISVVSPFPLFWRGQRYRSYALV
jgi:hypothetical protein